MKKSRISYYDVAPEGLKEMFDMEKYVYKNLEKSLVELVKIRVSQLNGCAFCINMHTQEARKAGESEQRIYLLNAWTETDLYTARERAALQLAEAVTHISTHTISDDFYESVRSHFTEREFVDLLLAINQINSWNRISITMANPLPK